MKVRLDFVTNSSSSSYIVATKNDDKHLMKQMDIILLKWVKEMLFGQESIKTLDELNKFAKERGWEDDYYDYLKIKECLENNYTVHCGEIYCESENEILYLYENLFNTLMKQDVGFEAIDIELGY